MHRRSNASVFMERGTKGRGEVCPETGPPVAHGLAYMHEMLHIAAALKSLQGLADHLLDARAVRVVRVHLEGPL